MKLIQTAVRNPIAVNLLMWSVMIFGVYHWFTLVREMFPNSDPEQVLVSVRYPGATPDEVEKSVTLRLEREIEDVDGVEKVESEILESATALRITLDEGVDRDRVLNDLRTEIDKITPDLPDDADDPEIVELRPFIPVLSIVVHGNVSEERLRDVVEDVEDELMDLSEVSEVRVSGVREREIHVEIQPERLEEHDLTFGDVGRVVGSSNLDLPGGQLKTSRGNVRVRTLGEEDRARELEDMVVRSSTDGMSLTLGDLATVSDGFEDKIERGRFKQASAATLNVFKTPEEDALDISEQVHAHIEANAERLGGAVKVEVLTDISRLIRQRLDLMIRNARTGLVLVMISLALFLDLRVAWWVSVGLAVAFLGTFMLMAWMGVSINLISLFGLIVVLGLIVDDAIVIGENIFTRMRQGLSPADAAVQGAGEVSFPVIAAVCTTIVAFAPLAFIEGRIGSFLGVLPLVVIAALAVSLVESLIILPVHLSHTKPPPEETDEAEDGSPSIWGRVTAAWHRFEAARMRFLEHTLPGVYERTLRFVLRWRYATLAAALAFSVTIFGLVAGDVVPFVLLQKNDAETILIDVEMAAGTPESRTVEVVERLQDLVDPMPETESAFAVVGTSFSRRGQESAADPATVGQVTLQLKGADVRETAGLRTAQFVANEIRERSAEIPGVRTLRVAPQTGGPTGPDIEIQVRGDDFATLSKAVAHVREELASYDGVSEIEDDLRPGKLEARLRLRDSARALGLTTRDVALQLRHALFGFEAQDLQKAREEITVRAVLPEAARRDLDDLARLRIATPGGQRVPLDEVAELVTERGYASLARVDGERAVTIKAEVDQARANTSKVTSELAAGFAGISDQFPGVTVGFEGRRQDTRESLGSLAIGFPVAMLVIFAILAVLFGSYMQPLLVMAAIPFAFVGAVIGHWVMGFPFTILSMIGTVALAGIVVNDSLILMDFINKRRREGARTVQALVDGGRARLRAILLTTITTCAGLGPLLLEKSFQAQFLIPMAVAIVFGLAFATVITLLLLPTIYLVGEDLRASLRWLLTGTWQRHLPELG